jgi:proteasome lid subunit RPN8/RPN11
MIILAKKFFEEMIAHARAEFPLEACGLFGGTVDGEKKIVRKVYCLMNTDKSREHFSMTPAEQFAAVKDMRSNGWKLLGNFHSHPETPARMSDEDKRLAFDKNLSYMILSLATSEPILKSFRFDTGAENFLKEEIKILGEIENDGGKL